MNRPEPRWTRALNLITNAIIVVFTAVLLWRLIVALTNWIFAHV